MFIEALYTIAKSWKGLSCPSTDDWIKMCGPYIQWIITQLSKRMISQYLLQHGGTGGDNAK